MSGEKRQFMMDKTGKEVKNYKSLLVWKKSMELVKKVYELTNTFPEIEKFGLFYQTRRSAISIPSNIAEGQARNSTKEFIRFLSVAKGSLAELDTQIILAKELNYICHEHYECVQVKIDELQRMFYNLIKKLGSI
ncbi:MAG TPA: four helix bundle protein [Desulfomonilia bacterium]